MARQDFNKKINNILSERKFFESFMDDKMSQEVYEVLDDVTASYPDQRWGQLFTNYVYPEYRQRNDSTLNNVMDIMFYGVNMDPFFEESEDTYNRLNCFENWCTKNENQTSVKKS